MNIAHIDELEAIAMRDGFVWRPVRHRFGIRRSGQTPTPPGSGGQVVEEHTEEQLGHEEIYLVVRGRMRFTAGSDEHELKQGQLIFVRTRHSGAARSRSTEDAAVLAIGGKPGEPYEMSAWETMVLRRTAVAQERWDEVIALHHEALERAPRPRRVALQPRVHGGLAGKPDEALAAPATSGQPRAEVGRQRREGPRLRLDQGRAGLPGSLTPSASARSAGTGSLSGRATSSTAP